MGDEPVGSLVFHLPDHPGCVIQIAQSNANDIPTYIPTCIVITIQHFLQIDPPTSTPLLQKPLFPSVTLFGGFLK